MQQVHLTMSCEQETSFNGISNNNSSNNTPRTTGGSRNSIKQQKILCLRLRVPLIKSCFCWKSVRKGSFASGIYTLAFYTIVFTTCAFQVNNVFDESSTFAFSLAMLILSGSTVISSILLIVALCGDNKTMMIPWLVTIIPTTIADITYFIYTVSYHDHSYRMIFAATTDVIICALNVYAIICVISQYQEYSEGRGLPGQRHYHAGDLAYTSTSIGSRCPSTGGYAIESTYAMVSETASVFVPNVPDEETGVASLKSPEDEDDETVHTTPLHRVHLPSQTTVPVTSVATTTTTSTSTNPPTAAAVSRVCNNQVQTVQPNSIHVVNTSSSSTSASSSSFSHSSLPLHHSHDHSQVPNGSQNYTVVSFLQKSSAKCVKKSLRSNNTCNKRNSLINSCCNSVECKGEGDLECTDVNNTRRPATVGGGVDAAEAIKATTVTEERSFHLNKLFPRASRKCTPNQHLIAHENLALATDEDEVNMTKNLTQKSPETSNHMFSPHRSSDTKYIQSIVQLNDTVKNHISETVN